MPEVKPSQILRLAIELIKKRGWTTGQWEDQAGCLCAAGAINRAAIQMEATNRQYTAARIAANRVIESGDGLIRFNDQQTSRTPVLRKLGEAARQLEKVGK